MPRRFWSEAGITTTPSEADLDALLELGKQIAEEIKAM